MFGDRLKEATTLYERLPREMKSLVREMRSSMEEDYIQAEYMSFEDLNSFCKSKCHITLWVELKARIPDLPDLVHENEMFWLANVVNNTVTPLKQSKKQRGAHKKHGNA